jgi:hypothetical protein
LYELRDVDAGDFLGLETTKIRSIIETCSMRGTTKTQRGKRVRDPKTETGLAIEEDLLKKKEREKRKRVVWGVGPVYKKRPCMAAIV